MSNRKVLDFDFQTQGDIFHCLPSNVRNPHTAKQSTVPITIVPSTHSTTKPSQQFSLQTHFHIQPDEFDSMDNFLRASLIYKRFVQYLVPTIQLVYWKLQYT